VVALEQLAAAKSLKVLNRQKSAEKDERTKGNILRAIASTGRSNRSAQSAVLKAAEKDKSNFLRINAIIGLVYLEDREKVNAVLVQALNHEKAGIRAG